MQGNFSPQKGLNRRNSERPVWSKQLGYTITELITIVALISIVASLAAPSYTSIINNQAVTAASTNIVALLQMARTEAIKQSKRVKACFTIQKADFSTVTTPKSCVDPGSTEFKVSYLYVFIDDDTGTAAEDIDSTEVILAASAEFNSNLYFNQNSNNMGTSIEFNQRGSAVFQASETLTTAYIAICDERSDESAGRLLTLNATGRTALSSIPTNSQVACYDIPTS